jgi:hypothetical protein
MKSLLESETAALATTKLPQRIALHAGTLTQLADVPDAESVQLPNVVLLKT